MSESENQAPQIDFVIQKIYMKDMSFEAPNSPEIFKNDWTPEANIDLNTATETLDNDIYEVNLTVTVTAKSDQKTAFLVEVKQTGIFTVTGAADEQMAHILGSYCPSILFPYAREAIASLVFRGGFPELNMAPINFDALYAQSQTQQAAENVQ